MKMSLEVFEVIRTAAKAGPGTALLMPFDGSLFIDYSPEKMELFGLIRVLVHVGTLGVKGPARY